MADVSTSSSSSSSNLISGAIKWTGLSSGTDFASVVEKLVAIEQRTITRQQTWRSQWSTKLTSIGKLDERLVSLKYGAQEYDTRSEFLVRKATSSKTDVVTLTNTSSAPIGTYSVTVGENIPEKLASRSYKSTDGIGWSHSMDANGHPLGADGKVIAATELDDENVLAVIKRLVPGNETVTFALDGGGPNGDYFGEDGVTVIAHYDAGAKSVTLSSNNEVVVKYDGANLVNVKNNNELIPCAAPDPDDFYYPPMTISMGGNTLTLTYDEAAAPGNGDGKVNGSFTMDQLAEVINKAVAAGGASAPNISAAVIYDKTRGADTHSRLVLTGLEGGTANHITVSDPTNLCFTKTHIDDPVTAQWIGSSTTKPKVADSSAYTGHVNKTFTIMTANTGVLGQDDITFQWADTEGRTGKFTITKSDWQTNPNKEYEIAQGLKISFDGSAGGRLQKDEAFTVDCQAPVMQKANDSGMAQTDKWIHEGMADQLASVTKNSGDFIYSFAGTQYSVAIPSDCPLSRMATLINEDSKNPGVTASIINDGMGTATSYRLVLTGNKTGAENAIRIIEPTDASRRLSNFNVGEGHFKHAREASNSMTRIDGFPEDGSSWLQRQQNEVGDVIDGVVLSLHGIGESFITVGNDTEAMKLKVQAFVSSVNFVKTIIKEETQWGEGKLESKVASDGTIYRSETKANGAMIGNYGFQISQSTIDNIMMSNLRPYTMLPYSNTALTPSQRVEWEKKYGGLTQKEKNDARDKYLQEHGLVYTSLSDIGIASDPKNKGLYTIEQNKLSQCLKENPEAVIKLFTFVDEETVPTADAYGNPIFKGFAVRMAEAADSLTSNTDITDKDTGELIRKNKGVTRVLTENYQKIIEDIDDKIAREEYRISLVRDRYTQQFARLEKALSQLNGQSERVAAAVKQLPGSSSS